MGLTKLLLKNTTKTNVGLSYMNFILAPSAPAIFSNRFSIAQVDFIFSSVFFTESPSASVNVSAAAFAFAVCAFVVAGIRY